MNLKSLPKIYFGPLRPEPSWKWVGEDIAVHLSMMLSVHYFENVEDIPNGSIVFWIKNPGSEKIAEKIYCKKLILLFFPVDCFLDEQHITNHAEFIDSSRLICLHAQSLEKYFDRRKTAYVDHYLKYSIDFSRRIPQDYMLWIGAYQYVPYVLLELVQMRRPLPNVLLLTNFESERADRAAHCNAEKVGLPFFKSLLREMNLELQIWSEINQYRAMSNCRAAFDVKYIGCFNQFHKPPTKMQKYICSGIPCAINSGPAMRDQLVDFVPLLEQLEDLSLDERYCRGLNKQADKLRPDLTLTRVARNYIELAFRALTGTDELALSKSGLL